VDPGTEWPLPRPAIVSAGESAESGRSCLCHAVLLGLQVFERQNKELQRPVRYASRR
jgi:hypothetical protein